MSEKEEKQANEHSDENTKEEQENEQTPAGNTGDKDNLNVMSALGYVIFFLPMLTHNGNSYAMFHANQGLILLITAVIINIVGAVIPFIGWFVIWPLGWLFVLILAILGIVNALNGKKKELPLIGGFTILK